MMVHVPSEARTGLKLAAGAPRPDAAVAK